MPDFEQSENEHDNLLVISQIGLFEDVDQWIENPRVGGSIPPLGTTFTNKNNGLAERNAR